MLVNYARIHPRVQYILRSTPSSRARENRREMRNLGGGRGDLRQRHGRRPPGFPPRQGSRRACRIKPACHLSRSIGAVVRRDPFVLHRHVLRRATSLPGPCARQPRDLVSASRPVKTGRRTGYGRRQGQENIVGVSDLIGHPSRARRSWAKRVRMRYAEAKPRYPPVGSAGRLHQPGGFASRGRAALPRVRISIRHRRVLAMPAAGEHRAPVRLVARLAVAQPVVVTGSLEARREYVVRSTIAVIVAAWLALAVLGTIDVRHTAILFAALRSVARTLT